MTASNHVLTGAVFASATASVVSAWILLPVAFLLHFVMDMLPHRGEPDESKWGKDLGRLKWLLPVDATVATIVLLVIVITRPTHWPLLLGAGILCASPDLFSISRYRRFLTTGNTAYSDNWFNQWHHNIQLFERSWGIWVELAWFLIFSFIFISRL